jgi:F-type H+-transporting ATPase subunit a
VKYFTNSSCTPGTTRLKPPLARRIAPGNSPPESALFAAHPFSSAMSRSLVILASFLAAPVAFAAEGGGGGGIPLDAKPLFTDHGFLSFITNSIFVAGLVTCLILWFVRGAMKNAQLVPGKKQNAVEFIVEFLYGQVEKILGPKIAKQAFPLLATLFIFITVSNWCGLLPGVGTIGFDPHLHSGEWASKHIETPILRPATADMNLTLGMALASFLVWFVITIKEIGFVGFLKHTFGPKGGLKGFMGAALAVIFFLVGFIEIVSIAVRPLTLSLRLYGNIFAGENLLHSMGNLGSVLGLKGALNYITVVLFQLPFYFMELLVGVLQGMVFAMLNVVFIKLSTTHDESHDHGDESHAH